MCHNIEQSRASKICPQLNQEYWIRWTCGLIQQGNFMAFLFLRLSKLGEREKAMQETQPFFLGKGASEETAGVTQTGTSLRPRGPVYELTGVITSEGKDLFCVSVHLENLRQLTRIPLHCFCCQDMDKRTRPKGLSAFKEKVDSLCSLFKKRTRKCGLGASGGHHF